MVIGDQCRGLLSCRRRELLVSGAMHRLDDARFHAVSRNQCLLSAISIHGMLEGCLPRKQPCLDLPFGCGVDGLVQDGNSLFVLICASEVESLP